MTDQGNQQQSCLLHLPCHLLGLIVSFLPHNTRSRLVLRQVCKQFKAAFDQPGSGALLLPQLRLTLPGDTGSYSWQPTDPQGAWLRAAQHVSVQVGPPGRPATQLTQGQPKKQKLAMTRSRASQSEMIEEPVYEPPTPQQLTLALTDLVRTTGQHWQGLDLPPQTSLLAGLLQFDGANRLTHLCMPTPGHWGAKHGPLGPLTSLHSLSHLTLEFKGKSSQLSALIALSCLTHLGLLGSPSSCKQRPEQFDLADLAALPALASVRLEKLHLRMGLLTPPTTATTATTSTNLLVGDKDDDVDEETAWAPGWKHVHLDGVVCSTFDNGGVGLLGPSVRCLVLPEVAQMEDAEVTVLTEALAEYRPHILKGLQGLVLGSAPSPMLWQAKLYENLRLLHSSDWWPEQYVPGLKEVAPALQHLIVKPTGGIVNYQGRLGDMMKDLLLRLPPTLQSLHVTTMQQQPPTFKPEIPLDFSGVAQHSLGVQSSLSCLSYALGTVLNLTQLCTPSLKRLAIIVPEGDIEHANSSYRDHQAVAEQHHQGSGSKASTTGMKSFAKRQKWHISSDDMVDISPSSISSLWLVGASIAEPVFQKLHKWHAQNLTRLVLISMQGLACRTPSQATKIVQPLAALLSLRDLQLGCFLHTPAICTAIQELGSSCPKLQHMVIRLHRDYSQTAAGQRSITDTHARLAETKPSLCVGVVYIYEDDSMFWPAEHLLDGEEILVGH